ncbi:MAG: DUF6488 family protein [Sulfuricurvum sp.]|uniref:DUF6488 family protein n=1 Tax=Sulfuricurvum sp. TaxID=2025608 RepID=UPI0027338B2A|nr:DUF6488 family protein [Sulfuricurvum sp.]MDP2849505.1 DUF6488 family protein [Sulfuricurvum sp.]
MKKAIAMTLITTTLGAGWFGLALHAGSGHDHGPSGHTHGTVKEQASRNMVITSANQHIKQLVKANKIDASWEGCAPVKTEQKRFNATLEWVVQYRNPQIKDPSKMTLFVFVDVYGKVNAANHTGK